MDLSRFQSGVYFGIFHFHHFPVNIPYFFNFKNQEYRRGGILTGRNLDGGIETGMKL
jgi:hypothetical protein